MPATELDMPTNKILVHQFVMKIWGSIAGYAPKFKGFRSLSRSLEQVDFDMSDDGLGDGARKQTLCGCSLIIPRDGAVDWDWVRREIARRIESGEALENIRAF